ncbi:MAG TPA: Ku protein [Firmicutes bacterium]|nr:Ku protein [Bacillota bacterium]
MRSIWKGAVSFGLVNIPVKLYAATQNKSVSFHQLHRQCFTPIRYLKQCPHCQTEVPQEEIVRGYEYESGRFVVIEEADLAELPLPTTKTIEIMDFINLEEIDPIYFEKSYYLEPAEGAQKPYALLRLAMQQSGKAAVAKVALRHRESLCALRVFGKALALATMHYADEIRPVAQLEGIAEEPVLSGAEKEMALRLIENLTAAFEPEKYTDQYRTALLELIRNKASGKQIHEAPAIAPAAGKVVDLMAALEASIKATAEQKKKKAAPRSAPKRRTAVAAGAISTNGKAK